MYKIIGADGNQYGPVSLEELKNWIRDRRANGDTLAQGPGMENWLPLRQFPEVADVLGATAPVTPSLGATVTGANVREMVSGPATGLIIVGALVAAGNLLAIVSNLLGLATPMPQSTGDPRVDEIMKYMSGTVGIISGIIGIALGAVTIFAGLQMRKLQGYSLAMAMLIINMIPCCNSCCCLIGLPIGIWGLTVLMKPEVKSAFQ